MEIDFEKETLELLRIFELNLDKARMISEIKREHLKSDELGGFKENLEDLHSKVGVENVARSQSIVMMITSFEAYLRDFFNVMILRNDLLKKALRECDKLKANSGDLLKLVKETSSWGELIAKRELMSFQSFSGQTKALRMMGQEFEDILEETVGDINKLLIDRGDGDRAIAFPGEEIIKNALDVRHRVVHRGETLPIAEVDADNYVLFFQFLGGSIRNKFFPTNVKFIYKKFKPSETGSSEFS